MKDEKLEQEGRQGGTATQDAARQLRIKQRLRLIDRSRSRLIVCFYTLPLYAVAVILLLNRGLGVTALMFVYMGLYAIFAVDMVVKNCPRCGQQFFVKAFFLNFFTRKCVHCGIDCKVSVAEIEDSQGRRF